MLPANNAQPAQTGKLLFMMCEDHFVADRDRSTLADEHEQDALQAEEHRQRHDERRDAKPGDKQADRTRRSTAPMARQMMVAAHQGQSWSVSIRAHDCGGRAGREAGRQVDLAEQQDEDETHRDDDDRRTLVDQVGEVERRW